MPLQTPFGPGLIGEIDDKLWNVVKKLAGDAVTFTEPSIENAFVAGGPGGNIKPTGLLYDANGKILILPPGGVKFPDGSVVSSPKKSFVTSVNTLKGDVVLAPGANITITPAGNTLTFAATGGGLPAIKVLKETVFAGLPVQSLATGTTTLLDGSGYTVTLAGNGAVDIVATGLRLRQGTTGGAGLQVVQILAANTGNFNSFFTEERFRRTGTPFAFWSRIASYDYTNTGSGNVYGFVEMATPKWGCQIGRYRLIKGSPNTTVGGLAYDWWWNGAVTNTSTQPSIGVSPADVMCWVWRTPFYGEIYIGTYSGGWPLIGSMLKVGNVSMMAGASFLANSAADVGSTTVAINWLLGGQSATVGTYEIVFDRWRVTTWE